MDFGEGPVLPCRVIGLSEPLSVIVIEKEANDGTEQNNTDKENSIQRDSIVQLDIYNLPTKNMPLHPESTKSAWSNLPTSNSSRGFFGRMWDGVKKLVKRLLITVWIIQIRQLMCYVR